MSRRKPRSIVAIVWHDAVAAAGWTDHADAAPPAEIHSVGWLIKRTRSHVTIATSIGGDEHNGSMTIPRGMIQSLVVIA